MIRERDVNRGKKERGSEEGSDSDREMWRSKLKERRLREKRRTRERRVKKENKQMFRKKKKNGIKEGSGNRVKSKLRRYTQITELRM